MGRREDQDVGVSAIELVNDDAVFAHRHADDLEAGIPGDRHRVVVCGRVLDGEPLRSRLD